VTNRVVFILKKDLNLYCQSSLIADATGGGSMLL